MAAHATNAVAIVVVCHQPKSCTFPNRNPPTVVVIVVQLVFVCWCAGTNFSAAKYRIIWCMSHRAWSQPIEMRAMSKKTIRWRRRSWSKTQHLSFAMFDYYILAPHYSLLVPVSSAMLATAVATYLFFICFCIFFSFWRVQRIVIVNNYWSFRLNFSKYKTIFIKWCSYMVRVVLVLCLLLALLPPGPFLMLHTMSMCVCVCLFIKKSFTVPSLIFYFVLFLFLFFS